MIKDEMNAFEVGKSDNVDSQQWSRRDLLHNAAVLAGATLIAPYGANAQNRGTQDVHAHFGDSECSHIDASESPVLPDWAIGPFTRYAHPQSVPYQGNPICRPQKGWEDWAVFNPGVVYRDGHFHMLFRGQSQSEGNISQIGYAHSEDGHHFIRYPGNPVITNTVPNGERGAEDPRLYELDGKFYAFFTGYSGTSIDIDEAVSTDLIHWTHIRSVIKNNKNAAVVTDPSGRPVKINGRYTMYYGQNDNGTYIAFSTDMINWVDSVPIDLHFPDSYTPYEICVAMTDYPSVQGAARVNDIVLFVAGTLMAERRWFYAISEVLFSRKNLARQLAQLSIPILNPETAYEMLGRTKATVFMNTILFHDGKWWMYYGAGDTVTALATAPLRTKESVQIYQEFRGTSFESGQRQPDWINEVDGDHGGGGIKNVVSRLRSERASTAPAEFNAAEHKSVSGDVRGGPEAIVRHGEEAHSGDAALRYSGVATGVSRSYAYLRVFDLSSAPVKVSTKTRCSYWIYPQLMTSASRRESQISACVALDLIFSDGTALRNLKAHDQNGCSLTPAGQRSCLKSGQWNYVSFSIGLVAAGKRIVRIDIGFDVEELHGPYCGYIDDIVLGGW